MSDNGGNDSSKSRQDLLDELEELRGKLAKRDGEQAETGEPTFARPITRRTALTKWVAPAVLSIPLTALVRSEARAGETGPMTPMTLAPTLSPTSTGTATSTATFTPSAPMTPYPTTRPTSFPTGVKQVPGLGLGAAAVLGGGLAAGVAKVASDRAKAKREVSDTTSDDESQNEE